MLSFPVHNRTKLPELWLSYLDEGPECAVLAAANSDGTGGQCVLWFRSNLKLRLCGQVQALRVRLAPRHKSFREHAPDGHLTQTVAYAKAPLRTEARTSFVRRLVVERLTALLARFIHVPNLAPAGLCTVPFFNEQPTEAACAD